MLTAGHPAEFELFKCVFHWTSRLFILKEHGHVPGREGLMKDPVLLHFDVRLKVRICWTSWPQF